MIAVLKQEKKTSRIFRLRLRARFRILKRTLFGSSGEKKQEKSSVRISPRKGKSVSSGEDFRKNKKTVRKGPDRIPAEKKSRKQSGSNSRKEPVKKVIVEETLPGDWHRLLVRAEPGTDTREKAAAIIAAHGYATRHIYRHIPSLEDVFVEMTRKD